MCIRDSVDTAVDGALPTATKAGDKVTKTGGKAAKKAVPTATKAGGKVAKKATPAAQQTAGGVAGSVGTVLGEAAGTATQGGVPATGTLPVQGLPLS